MTYIHKNGIKLCKVEKEHLSVLKDLKNESWFGTHNIAVVNDLNQQKWFEKISSDANSLYLTALDINNNDDPVGVYKINNIDWISRFYDSAHDVFSFARGKGYGYTILEAGVDFGFEVLNMHRLNTEVLENNKASMKTALSAGFQVEGTKRRIIHKCGQWLDSVCLGLLREDWEELERVKKYGNVCNFSYAPKDRSQS